MDHVILERDCESTVVFVEGAREAYLGYVTIKVGPFKDTKYLSTYQAICNLLIDYFFSVIINL